jgi:DNA-binding winged helix-turn-helix (wHTH) protein/class 3 adenylate cyclase
MVYIFGDCELHTCLHILRRAGQLKRLRPKVLYVLVYLLEHRDRVVTKRELCEQIWPKQYISDATLESTLRTVRQILGDNGRTKRLIQTIYGSGYRFIAPVEIRADDQAQAGLTASPVTAVPTPHRSVEAADGDGSGYAALVSHETTQGPPLSDSWEESQQLVTLLCGSLVDARALSTRQGPGTLCSLMRVLYNLTQTVVQRYGGTILYVAGGSFMAMFGALVAREHHAQRAVLAALDLHWELDRYRNTSNTACASELVVRMSLHTGPVIVGGKQDLWRIPPVVIGDTAILATSYETMAEPGAILCSAATARFVQDMGHIEAIGPMWEVGQSMPHMLYRVQTEVSVTPPPVAYVGSGSGANA